MKAAEKLLQDIVYWEDQAREAREALQIAESVLPGLRKSLEDLEEDGLAERVVAEQVAAAAAMDRAQARGAQASSPGEIRLRGLCDDQVEQALEANSPQSPEGLVTFLEEHGRGYSRGAVNYALRKLRDQGKIREVKKEGNLRFYAPVKAGAQAAS